MEKENYQETMKERRIMDIMMRLCHDIFLRNYQQMSEKGLHPGQAVLLKQLDRSEGMTQRELANNLHIKPPTVAVSVKRLEKAGLICRRQDEEDQRKSRIFITEEGRDLVRDIQSIMECNDEYLFKGFTDVELCLLRRFLIQMMENMA